MHTSNRHLGFELVFLGLFALAGCGGPGAGARYPTAADDPRLQPYVIGPSDVVDISVWNNPDLSTKAVVRPDGTITMPVVGELRAAGRTVAELQKEAAERADQLVKDAVVTVSVAEVNSYRFTVAGNVERPGLFTSRYYLTLSQAIALAGGPNRYASTDRVIVVRRAPSGKLERLRVNYDTIVSGQTPDQDLVLRAGDAVQVP